jgi:hypothetical protein
MRDMQKMSLPTDKMQQVNDYLTGYHRIFNALIDKW